jgi:methylated-DNA-[protein]-cysteine S-methyltransferase
MFYSYISSPLGMLLAEANQDGGLTRLDFMPAKLVEGMIEKSEVFEELSRQLEEYFEKRRLQFELKLAPEGTEFQQRVWRELQTIPFGHTMSYGKLAKKLGGATLTRAVGRANGANPIAIVVPCHRVIGEDGKMVGYAGGMERKGALLRHEGALLL